MFTKPNWLIALLIACAGMIPDLNAQVIINEVAYSGSDRIELFNAGDTERDVSTWWLCARFSYARLDNSSLSMDGELLLQPGDFLVISGFNLDDQSSDLGLYATNAFGSTDAIRDFVQYGEAGIGREGVAAAAGIWTSGDFVPNVGTGSSIEFDGEGDSSTDWIEQSSPTFGAANEAAETGSPAIRFTLVDPIEETVTIKNFGTASRNISAYQLCLGPGQYNILNNYTNLDGDLNLDPQEEVSIDLTSGSLNVQALPDENGGLTIFANNSFGSSSPEDVKDYIQWGAADQNRVEQSVTAERWDDAENFVPGAAPYVYVGEGEEIGARYWVDHTLIRMTLIDPQEDEVILKNFDTISREISTYFFCTQAGIYPEVGDTNDVTVLEGDLTLDPNEVVRLRIVDAGGVVDSEGSIFLFSTNVLGFNNQNAAVTRDFAQWDAGNGFRVENAVITGRWDDANSFIAGNAPYTFIGEATDIGADFWEAQAGEAIVRFLIVDPLAETVTLKNFGTEAQDISDYQFCLGPGQYNILNNYTTIDGDLILDPQEEVTFDLTSGSLNVQALPDVNGGLTLFANNSFGSSSPDDVKDFIQWGAANQNRVGQSVTAGRWDDAESFVEGLAPYTFIGEATDIGADFWEAQAGEAIVRFLIVDPLAETVTLKNFGTEAQDISDYQFCLGPGQYNILNNYTTIDGDLILDPQEEVTFVLTSGSLNVQALPDVNGGLTLFANNSFGSSSPDDVKDFIQWGAANQNRVGQSVTAGRWDDAESFVEGLAPYTFIGEATDIGADFWEATQLSALAISKFVLLDAEADKDLLAIQDGAQIGLFTLGTTELSVQAVTDPKEVGSVAFYLNGEFVRIENRVPYTLGGDINGDVRTVKELVAGTFTLRAVPFSEPNGNGTVGEPLEVTFELIALPTVNSFTLINADTDEDIQEIYDGEQIDLSTLPTKNLNIRANTIPAYVGSVRFNLNGEFSRTENLAPYALGGDIEGDFGRAQALVEGAFILEAIPFTQRNAQGDAGEELIISFQLLNSTQSNYNDINSTFTFSAPSSLRLDRVALYPNPGTDIINVEIPELNSSSVGVSVFTLTGSSVFTNVISGEKGVSLRSGINISEYPAGIYLLQVQNGDQLITKRFVKQ